ncbi:MAG: hypothetical protein ABSC60_14715, partial [Acidobacteriota bacterium]
KLPPELAANEPKNAPAPKITAKVAGSGAKTPPPSPAFNRGACTAGIDSGVFALIESIDPRRTPVVDEERGVTWGVYVFNHPGVKEVKMPDGSIKPAAGKIRDIMAVGVINKYKSDSGWKQRPNE